MCLILGKKRNEHHGALIACHAGPNTPVVGDAEGGTERMVVVDVRVVEKGTAAPMDGTHVKLIDTGGTYDERWVVHLTCCSAGCMSSVADLVELHACHPWAGMATLALRAGCALWKAWALLLATPWS